MSIETINKSPTRIEGFDHIACGGLPEGRSTLVAGTSGSAKTVFAAQFLAEGIMKSGEPGVFITFEENVENLRRNIAGFGWDIEKWEADGKWIFIDASPQPFEQQEVSGDYTFDGLLIRLRAAIEKIGAKRLVIDSLGCVFQQFTDAHIVRREMFGIIHTLNTLGVTSIITSERTEEYGPLARFGVEEFVTDNVVILRNVLDEEKRRRTIEILKFRGTDHLKGEFPFTVQPTGIYILPLSALELIQKSTSERISSGIPDLDEMCGGGFFRDSIILISGATGTGKTLTSTQFLGCGDGRALLYAFEESREQLFRNASGWGMDFEALEKAGRLKVVCVYPEVKALEDHLLAIKREVEEFKPTRIAIDSLSALERVAGIKPFREFVIGLTSFIKHKQVAGLFTATTPNLMGGSSVTEAHISTITDSIILLRYVEIFGEMRRGLTVLKMRGSAHDKNIREFDITSAGMRIGRPFRGVSGIISGLPMHKNSPEIDHLGDLIQKLQ